jgi:hypothetical protein
MLAVILEDTIATLYQLHPLPLDHVPPLIFYYQPKHTFLLDRTLFARAITSAPHLYLGGLFGMVYEHFFRCFIPKDPSSGFSKLFQVIAIVVCGDIPRSMALVLWASKLLAMAKDIGGFHLI